FSYFFSYTYIPHCNIHSSPTRRSSDLYLTSFIPFIIFPYYCVIGGWVTKYTAVSLQGDIHAAASDDFFTGFIGKTGEPIFYLLVDRKSTRLNSSHVSISYAVFCLKKKT